MIAENLLLVLKKRWFAISTVHVTGKAFVRHQYCDSEALATQIALQSSTEDIIDLLRSANGFFSVICIRANTLLLAVDRVRSVPLFYEITQDRVCVTDDPAWVEAEHACHAYDGRAAVEYGLTGYVTGGGTLYQGVHQVQAGEVLCISLDAPDHRVRSMRYFRYLHQATLPLAEDEYLERLDATLLNVFQRLVQRAHGRQLVVPLSGGRDSRLVIMMLKRMGYQNVLTYTYGREGNHDSAVSRLVASQIGYDWVFVPYSLDKWREWRLSSQWSEYFSYAGRFAGIPHIQDWPAVWELARRGTVCPDSIFIPGHSADLLAGSRSRAMPRLYSGSYFRQDLVVTDIIAYHYSLWPASGPRRTPLQELRPRVTEIIRDIPCSLPDEAVSAFELWDWQERQAKFIVNSVRVYEFWGFDWWLPFWDAEFMDYWSKVPLSYRNGKCLYDRYVDALWDDMFGGIGLTNPTSIEPLQAWRSRARNLPLAKLKPYIKRLIEYNSHPLAWYGAIDPERFRRSYTGRESINSFLADAILRRTF